MGREPSRVGRYLDSGLRGSGGGTQLLLEHSVKLQEAWNPME